MDMREYEGRLAGSSPCMDFCRLLFFFFSQDFDESKKKCFDSALRRLEEIQGQRDDRHTVYFANDNAIFIDLSSSCVCLLPSWLSFSSRL